VLIIGNSKSFHLGAQSTFNPGGGNEYRIQDWPLQDIVITNIVWCMAHTQGRGRGACILPNRRAIVLQQ